MKLAATFLMGVAASVHRQAAETPWRDALENLQLAFIRATRFRGSPAECKRPCIWNLRFHPGPPLWEICNLAGRVFHRRAPTAGPSGQIPPAELRPERHAFSKVSSSSCSWSSRERRISSRSYNPCGRSDFVSSFPVADLHARRAARWAAHGSQFYWKRQRKRYELTIRALELASSARFLFFLQVYREDYGNDQLMSGSAISLCCLFRTEVWQIHLMEASSIARK